MNRRVMIVLWSLCGILAATTPAGAQSRPLLTEDPETVPTGYVLFEAGVETGHAAVYPASGLTGNLLKLGTFGVSVGVSPIAEIQLDGGLRNRLSITTRAAAPLSTMVDVPGAVASDVEDLSIGAKVRFAAETDRRPSMAVRFSTRLPNAGNESGLGLDTTDFYFGFALAKTVESIRVAGNLGFAILPDPVRGDRQNDVLAFGLSLARAIRTDVEVVGEINSRLNTRSGVPPVGTESRGTLRVGSRWTHGPVRFDGGLLLGMTDRDPSWGMTAGLTWVFKAFTLQP